MNILELLGGLDNGGGGLSAALATQGLTMPTPDQGQPSNIMQSGGADPMAAFAASTGDGSQTPPPQSATPPNFMQTFGGDTGIPDATAPQAPPALAPTPPPSMVPPAAAAPAAPVGTQPARAKSSLIDKLGRVADVLATVGGAHPLYQPTLDSRQDRALALGDHDRLILADGAKLNHTNAETAYNQAQAFTEQNKNFSQAVNRLKSIVAADPNTDVEGTWAQLAQQAGIPADKSAVIGKYFKANPTAIAAMADGSTTQDEKYSGQTQMFRDKDGHIHVIQPSQGAEPARDLTAEHPDWEPVAPLQVINTGGTTLATDKFTGAPRRTFTNTEKPGAAADRQERANKSRDKNTTAITIAGMPARSGGGKGGPSDKYTGYLNGVHALAGLDKSLGDLAGDSNLSGATGLLGGRLNVTDGQRAIRGKIESLTGQAIPAAINAIKAAGGAAPRAASEIFGEVQGLIGAVKNRDMPTDQYIASINAARGRLRSRMADLTAEATRNGYATAPQAPQAARAPAAAPRRVAPAIPQTRPVLARTPPGGLRTQSNW